MSSPPLSEAPPLGTRNAPTQRRTLAVRAGAGAALLAGMLLVRATSPWHLTLSDRTRDFATLAISIVVESIPFVLLGVAVSIVVQVWVPQQLLVRLLPERPVPRRAAMSLLGVLLPVCECGNVPLSRGLLSRGLRVPEVMTFLLAAPILNPVTLVTTYQAFGFSHAILWWRLLGGFAIANFAGWLFSKHPRPEQLLTPAFLDSCAPGDDHAATASSKARRAARLFTDETAAMMPALVVGAALAAAIQVGVPRSVLVALGQNPIWSVPALMTLAFVTAICSNVDAFFVLSLSSTFKTGAVVAFLVFGPMVDVKMLALLRTTFRTSALVLVTTVVALSTAALALAVNLVA